MSVANEMSPGPGERTVAGAANECLASFQKCLLWASCLHARELSLVEDQVARFSTWASAIGVFAPGRASMDHRLRNAPDVQTVVVGLLESLGYRISKCNVNVNMILGLDDLCVLGENAPEASQGTQNERLQQSFDRIRIEISHLNKLSNTIRKASKEDQISRAKNFQVTDENGNDVASELLFWFKHHIGDRFPNVSETIKDRLARTMLLRRRRILYRRHRQNTGPIRTEKSDPETPVKLPAVWSASPLPHTEQDKPVVGTVNAKSPRSIPSLAQSATTLDPEKFQRALTPSVVSKSKTIALGNHEDLVFPPAPGHAAKRKYQRQCREKFTNDEKSVVGTAEEELEQLLKSELEVLAEITCPYCLYALPAHEVFDEQKWINHVKNDLDPYICLFEDCELTDILFAHADEWTSHLDQHCKLWRCNSHPEKAEFAAREDYMAHMRQDHHNTLSDSQLRALANSKRRTKSKIFPSCPLCGKEEGDLKNSLETHIAGHLRYLAIKSLPSYEEMSSDIGSDGSSANSSQQRIRSTLRDSFDEISAVYTDEVGLSQALDIRLTKKIRSTRISDDHPAYLDMNKVEDWDSDCYQNLGFRKIAAGIEKDPVLAYIAAKKVDEVSQQPAQTRTTDGKDSAGEKIPSPSRAIAEKPFMVNWELRILVIQALFLLSRWALRIESLDGKCITHIHSSNS
ncbi:serine/threonine protein phosphatase [Colletotrichum musicola]|uniref:Serine/threonine protein phosphatase n=1 Tax=Colletotrichum musicola TaxID=2175873 RepID=A0A8H6K992_9PEZI|nr:serine/threonine protein phosphatase [Colletotrichum musicola]